MKLPTHPDVQSTSILLEKINNNQELLSKLVQKWYSYLVISDKNKWESNKAWSSYAKLTATIVKNNWIFSLELNKRTWVRRHSHQQSNHSWPDLEYSTYSSKDELHKTYNDYDKLIWKKNISVDEYFKDNYDILILEWDLKLLANYPKFMKLATSATSKIGKTLLMSIDTMFDKIRS